ncbi:MAG: aldehyde dehydrogenase family protein [Acidimicrobiales bacterium]
MSDELASLEENQPILYGGNRVTRVSPELAAAFAAGDRLLVVDQTGDLLHVPAGEWDIAAGTVGRAHRAFLALGAVTDEAITDFFDRFAVNLADDDRFAAIAAANTEDVERAKQRGRSTTRLELSDKMRADMIGGLHLWRDASSGRDAVLEVVEHDGWRLEQRTAGLGVVGFVFEGRPNVFADACGVIRSGNAVAFRIGSDALATARAIVEQALDPALESAGLPPGTASLIDSSAHAAGWAMFADDRLALAVARGSGTAVEQLGAVARQVGTPVSLHGTGGAWIITGEHCDGERLQAVVANSLDRKVCNTVNTCCVLAESADRLVPAIMAGLSQAASEAEVAPKLHVTASAEPFVDRDWFSEKVTIARAEGDVTEAKAESIADDQLGREWEWETSPEITITVVDSVEQAVELFNNQSPRFVASLISDDQSEKDAFWAAIDAPFVGDGFTRWVDGQYALNKPELGLSNWQFGRLFGRGGVLSGESVFTVRSRVAQSDSSVRR